MKFAKKKGLLGEKLIFAEETVENPVSGEEIHQVRCFCSNCKTEFIASPVVNGCGYAYYTSGFVYNGKKYAYYDKTECPHCYAPGKISGTRYYSDNLVRDGVYIQGYEKIDGNFAVITWKLAQTVSMDNRTTEYTSDVREAFIDVINSQQQEIDRLNGWVNSLEELCERKTALLTDANWSLITTRAEAIKEFAEKLKANRPHLNTGEQVFYIRPEEVDNLVKEMVGDE